MNLQTEINNDQTLGFSSYLLCSLLLDFLFHCIHLFTLSFCPEALTSTKIIGFALFVDL